MLYLVVVSLIWAFSFGLIKENLVTLDGNLVAALRLLLAGLVFLPWLRIRDLNRRLALGLIGIGALQYGLMYCLYIWAYQYLQAYEVALFTVLTPIYLSLLNDLLGRRFSPIHLGAALLAVLGAGVVVFQAPTSGGGVTGFLLVQGANLCFAGGQVAYRRLLRPRPQLKDLHLFALLFLGGLLVAGPTALISTDWSALHISWRQVLVLSYLGLIASGLCFFLWNSAARRVDAGVLAVGNNLKLPLAMAISLFIFGEEGDLLRLLIGGGLVLLALCLKDRRHGEKLPG